MTADDATSLRALAIRTLQDCRLLAGDTTRLDVGLLKRSVEYLILHVSWCNQEFLIKQASSAARESKLFNGCIAAALAREQGVPTPTLRHFFCSTGPPGRATLVFDFLPGRGAELRYADFSAEERLGFFADLGKAVGLLHRQPRSSFSEELYRTGSGDFCQVIDARLNYCLAQPAAFAAVDPQILAEIRLRLGDLRDRVARVSQPVLIHGDIGLRNLLEHQHRFAGLIDFEHAKFHDPAYDFVKLSFFLADQPDCWQSLLQHYFAEIGEVAQFGLRLQLLSGIEILSGLPYWHRTGDSVMHADYLRKLDSWLETASAD